MCVCVHLHLEREREGPGDRDVCRYKDERHQVFAGEAARRGIFGPQTWRLLRWNRHLFMVKASFLWVTFSIPTAWSSFFPGELQRLRRGVGTADPNLLQSIDFGTATSAATAGEMPRGPHGLQMGMSLGTGVFPDKYKRIRGHHLIYQPKKKGVRHALLNCLLSISLFIFSPIDFLIYWWFLQFVP